MWPTDTSSSSCPRPSLLVWSMWYVPVSRRNYSTRNMDGVLAAILALAEAAGGMCQPGRHPQIHLAVVLYLRPAHQRPAAGLQAEEIRPVRHAENNTAVHAGDVAGQRVAVLVLRDASLAGDEDNVSALAHRVYR